MGGIMQNTFTRLLIRLALPLGAVAVLSAASVSSAAAAPATPTRPAVTARPATLSGFPSTCNKFFGCNPQPPIFSLLPLQLITNGGFENGGTGWSLNTGATVTSSQAHCGTSSVGLQTFATGSNSYFFPAYWSGEADQTINVPATTGSVSFTMWGYFPPYSYMHDSNLAVLVAARSNGYVYTPVAQYSNATTTPGVWRQLGPIDFTAYQGGTVYLMIEGSTPVDSPTPPIYVDDVSVLSGTSAQIQLAGGGC
jgi:hypothetical protein